MRPPSDVKGNWDDDGTAGEPRRGRLTLLILILVVIGLGALGVIGVVLGAKALRLVSDFAVHTQRIKLSPDQSWALVIDTYDEGALGGSTTVYLKPARSKAHTYTLHEPDWLPNWAVRWLDARTVMLGGELLMPFVAKSLDTGSPATSGAAIDASGYAANAVAAHERVVMLSGLSLVPPKGSKATLLTLPKSSPGRPRQELRSVGGGTWPGIAACTILAVTDRSELPDPHLATAGRSVEASLGRRVEVRWDAASGWLVIHARLRRRLLGFIWVRDVRVGSAVEAAHLATSVWRAFKVERIPPG